LHVSPPLKNKLKNKNIYYKNVGGVGKEGLWKKLNFVLLHFHIGNENLYSWVIKKFQEIFET
jgi:hypothetical protein